MGFVLHTDTNFVAVVAVMDSINKNIIATSDVISRDSCENIFSLMGMGSDIDHNLFSCYYIRM